MRTRWPVNVANAVEIIRSHVLHASNAVHICRSAVPESYAGEKGELLRDAESSLERIKEVLDAFEKTYPIGPRTARQLPLDPEPY